MIKIQIDATFGDASYMMILSPIDGILTIRFLVCWKEGHEFRWDFREDKWGVGYAQGKFVGYPPLSKDEVYQASIGSLQ